MKGNNSQTTPPDTYAPESEFPGRGGKYRYSRPAKHGKDGSVSLSQLADDEVIVWPGMIYKKIA